MRAAFDKRSRVERDALALLALFWAMVLFISMPSAVNAQPEGSEGSEPESEGPVYHFPYIAPAYGLDLGYWYAHVNGSGKAAEYDYPSDSLSFSAKYIAYPFPNRIHFEADVLNKKDYFSDLRYAYSDVVLFRLVDRSVFHNLDNIQLVDVTQFPKTSNSNYQIDPQDIGDKYGVGMAIDTASLRLKYPDYPLHVYAEGRRVEKDGTVQQRFLGGDADFDNLVRVSQARDIDWTTKELSVGANGHFGPVEVDFSHSEKRFDSGPYSILSFDYTNGTFAHNVISDTEGSSNTLKLHTSYTGRIFASATLSNLDRTNELSDAAAHYFTGAAQVRLIPVTPVVVSIRYRHEEFEDDNPSSLPSGFLGFSDFTAVTGITNSLSSKYDLVSADARYRARVNLLLGAGASSKWITRQNAAEWSLPDSTTEMKYDIYADYKPVRSVDTRLTYTHKEYDNPEFNIDPNRSNSGGLALTWTPITRVTVFADYELTDGHRDDITYNNSSGAKNRNSLKDKATTTVTVLVMQNLSCTAGYSYWHERVRQDIEAGSTLDPNVEYSDIVDSYSIGASYAPIKKLTLSPEVSYTRASGGFTPDIDSLLQPISIASFSAQKLAEIAFSVRADYEVGRGFRLGLNYSYEDYNDRLDNANNPETTDSTAHIVLATLTKRW